MTAKTDTAREVDADEAAAIRAKEPKDLTLAETVFLHGQHIKDLRRRIEKLERESE